MQEERADILDNYAFHFLEDVEEPFIQLVAIGRESRHSSRYHLENSGRGASYLFQYTLAGSGTVRIGGQEQLVDEGKAFFLRMPGEEGYYFDEARNRAPWEFLFAIFECHGAQRYCGQIELPGILQGDRGQAYRLPDQNPSGPGGGYADRRRKKRPGGGRRERLLRGQLFQQGVQKAYGHDACGVPGVCEAGGVFEDADITRWENRFPKPWK